MVPRFTCFISYPRLDNAQLMREFVDELQDALGELLKLEGDDPSIFVDVNQLKPGGLFEDELASAICGSLCMVVVYVPAYEKRKYCLREFDAMERIEQRRATSIKKGMIIPVLYHGRDIPPKIQARRTYADLRSFIPKTQSLLHTVRYRKEVEKIASYIHDVVEATSGANDLCDGCVDFKLAPETEIKPWRELPEQPFPR